MRGKMKYLIFPFGIFVAALIGSAILTHRDRRRIQRRSADARFGGKRENYG